MAYDEGLAEQMREDLAHLGDLTEKRMFGGLCFMHRGHMLCGVHKDGAMYRVGKPNQSAALALGGVGPMAFTGRPMGGFVEAQNEAMSHDETRRALTAMVLEFNASLPAK